MYNLAPRVSLSYSDISSVVVEWSKHVEKIICYEHEADSGVSRTHCHLLMMGIQYQRPKNGSAPDAFKRQFFELVKTDLKGQALWRWTPEEENAPDPDESFITYMSKGHLRPKFNNNFSDQVVEDLRLKWVEPIPKGTCLVTSDTIAPIKKKEKVAKVPYQQQIIAISYAEWIKYKNSLEDGFAPSPYHLVEIVCKAMREMSRGINAYLLQDICSAVLFDDPDFRERTLERLKSKIQL